MANNQIQQFASYSLVALAAEARNLGQVLLLPSGSQSREDAFVEALNNRDKNPINALTKVQALAFASDYAVVAHYAEDTAGVSMTLFRKLTGPNAGEYAVAVRDGDSDAGRYVDAMEGSKGPGSI